MKQFLTPLLSSFLFLCPSAGLADEKPRNIIVMDFGVLSGPRQDLKVKDGMLVPELSADKISQGIKVVLIADEMKCSISGVDGAGTIIRVDEAFVVCLVSFADGFASVSYIPDTRYAFFQQVRHPQNELLQKTLGKATMFSFVLVLRN